MSEGRRGDPVSLSGVARGSPLSRSSQLHPVPTPLGSPPPLPASRRPSFPARPPSSARLPAAHSSLPPAAPLPSRLGVRRPRVSTRRSPGCVWPPVGPSLWGLRLIDDKTFPEKGVSSAAASARAGASSRPAAPAQPCSPPGHPDSRGPGRGQDRKAARPKRVRTTFPRWRRRRRRAWPGFAGVWAEGAGARGREGKSRSGGEGEGRRAPGPGRTEVA